MASPVSTTVKFFTSTMPGAPVLAGQAGSLIGVLDACLKDGFGARPLTELTVAGGVATAKFGSGGAPIVHSVVSIAGASVAALNGEQRVVSTDAGSITFATAAPDGAASGSMTLRIAPSGWRKPFADTNLAVYQSADPQATQCLLRIDDTQGDRSRVRGYESMTDVNTGDGMFPPAGWAAGDCVWPKSWSANANPVSWLLISDGRVFYFHASIYQGNGSGYTTYSIGSLRGFGDMGGVRPGGDAFSCALAYCGSNTTSYPSYGTFTSGMSDSTAGALVLPRPYGGVGGPVFCRLRPLTGGTNDVSGADTLLGPFPSPIDGAMRLSPVTLQETYEGNRPVRADVPGLLYIPHTTTNVIAHMSQVNGSGNLAGRKLMAVAVGGSFYEDTSTSRGTAMVDITGPWR